MPQIQKRISDYPDVEHNVRETAFIYLRKLEYDRAKDDQRKRQKPFDQQRGRKAFEHRIHYRVCLKESAA